jgi:hypothetical protein
VKLVDSPAEIAGCTSIDESPGKAYVEVGLINPFAAFVIMLKRTFKNKLNGTARQQLSLY